MIFNKFFIRADAIFRRLYCGERIKSDCNTFRERHVLSLMTRVLFRMLILFFVFPLQGVYGQTDNTPKFTGKDTVRTFAADVQTECAAPEHAQEHATERAHAKKGVASFFIAATEVISANIALNAFDSIVLNLDFTRVTPAIIWQHLSKNLWEWDQNTFVMNQAGHPYLGAVFFNAGRANGFNFYESFLFALGGSLFWEEFMETSNPSINDMIYTPLAGAVLGEALHRLFLATNYRHMYATWLISPQDAFNRFITGKRAPPVSGHVESIELYASADALFRKTHFAGADDSSGATFPAFGTGVKITYGNRYGHDTREPFDSFTLRADVSAFTTYYNVKLFIDGLVFSFSPWEHLPCFSTFGIALGYDMIFASDVRYASSRLGVGLSQLCPVADEAWTFTWDAYCGWDVLNTTENNYYLAKLTNYAPRSKRTYDYYTGAFARLAFSVQNSYFGTLSIAATADFLFHIREKGKSAYDGLLLVQYAECRYEHLIWKSFYLGVSDFLYHKWNRYAKEPRVKFISNHVQLYGKVAL